jgi:hypothetical protein
MPRLQDAACPGLVPVVEDQLRQPPHHKHRGQLLDARGVLCRAGVFK